MDLFEHIKEYTMRDHAATTKELSAQRDRRREDAIDYAMNVTEKKYHLLISQEDQYAMHKAIESLPVSVLLYFANRQTDHDLSR